MNAINSTIVPNGGFATPADGAKFMVSLGIPQVPLDGKNPAINGAGWQDKATTDPTQIDAWAIQYKGCNFGSVAKNMLGGYFVIETDSPQVRAQYSKETGEESLGAKLLIQSGLGRAHWWFEHDAESMKLVNIGQKDEKGFSLRLHNEQCVSPGSIHPVRGTQYVVIMGGTPDVASPKLIAWLKSKKDTKAPVDVSLTGPRIARGGHDNELLRISGKLRHIGMEEEGIYNNLVEICNARFDDLGPDYLDMCRKHAHDRCKKPVGEEAYVLIGKDGRRSDIEEDYSNIPRGEDAEPVVVTALVSVDGDKFMVENIPPRKTLLRTISKKEGVFFEQSINQIFAWRGTGKTNIGLALTKAFATAGSFLNWEVPERLRVLYIEGEMPQSQLQERWNQIVGKTNGYARLITIDKQPSNIMPKLSTELGMNKVEATLTTLAAEGFKVEVLMLDSISTLFNVKANDEETWITIQDWLTSLRSRGLAIFFYHHSGKGGLSRSHSKSEDMLDVSIKLESPKEKESGCLHAIMTYDKSRAGLDEPSAEIKMRRTHSAACPCKKSGGVVIGCRGDGVAWEYRPTEDAKRSSAYAMFGQAATLGEVAKELGVTKSQAQRWKTKYDELAKLGADVTLA